MATTRVTHPVNGVGPYTFNFPLISRSHLRVYLDGSLVPSNLYSFPANGSIEFDVAPVGSNLELRRETPDSVSLTEYHAGATLTARDLTTDSLQARYLIQEEADAREVALGDLDDSLRAYTDDETAARIADVNAEEAARIAAVNDEEQARIAGDVNEKNQRIAAIEAEELARTLADNDLDARKIDRDEIPDYLVSIGDDAAQVGFQAAATGAELRSVADKLRDVISVKDFGAKGDGVTDDTAAIMAAYAYAGAASVGTQLVFPPGRYCVTSLTWTGALRHIRFDKAQLYGIATTPQSAVLKLHNFRHSKIEGLEIMTDGNVATPVYHPNYGCALQLTSDNGGSPTQYLTIDGLFIRYFKAGLVAGNLLGEPQQGSFPQSEIHIKGYTAQGTQQLVYQNAPRGFIIFSGCTFVRFKGNSTGWYDPNNGFILRNDEGQIVSIGDEFQTSEAGGWQNYGKNIILHGCLYENGSGDYITGDYTVRDTVLAFYGAASIPAITVAPGSTGRLLLSGVRLRRTDGTASANRAVMLDAMGSPDYRVTVENCYFKEWASDLVDEDGYLLRGGLGSFRGVIIDNSASSSPSWYVDDTKNSLTNVDGTGQSMSTTLDNTGKGGWVVGGTAANGAIQKYTADLPTGHTSAIRMVTTGAGANFQTPGAASGFRVDGPEDRTLRMLIKRLAATDLFRVQVAWWDFSGSALGGTTTVYSADSARLDANGLNEWSELRIPVKVPAGAVFGRIVFLPGSATDVAVTGLKVL